MDIRSKMMTFRLQTVQRLLYQCGLWWQETAEQLLKRISRLGYNKQLFLVRLDEVELTGLSSFYTSVLGVWQGLKHTKDSAASPASISDTVLLQSVLCSAERWLCRTWSSDWLRRWIRSFRILDRRVKEVCASLPGPMRAYIENQTCGEQWEDRSLCSFPALTVAPVVGEWQEERDKLLTFVTPKLGRFEAVEKKPLYELCVKLCHLDSLVGVKVSKWTEARISP